MQRRMLYLRRSEDEEIKEAGLKIDFDEIARRGSMSKEEKNIAKWYGVYGSKHPGNHMARVVIPGGVITSTQARNIAEVAEKYGQGRLNITTRQAIQFHWLKVGALADMMRDLAQEGSTTKHGCGDVTRNIAACPLAESCKYARFDVRSYALKTAKYLGDAHDLENLPRKFKITYSGCGAGCAQPFMNCLGAIAVVKDGPDGSLQKGFRVIIGGGMGWKAFVGQELFSFVPAERMVQVSRSIALLFRDHGDRYNRAKSRLKWVVHRKGIEKCREIVLEFLREEGVDTQGILTEPIQETGKPFPHRPLTEEDPLGTDGKVTVRAMIPMGELSFTDFAQLADLADEFGNQRVYTTNRQNIELMGIEPEKVEAVKQRIREIGFETEGFYGLKDIVPCVGLTYCPKAVATTRNLYALLQPLVRKEKYKDIQKRGLINITGCPNSCSPYRIVDIGFRGMRIREELGSVEGFEMLIGGDEEDHGKKIGEFKTADCAEVVETVLDKFLEVGQGDETLTQCVNRLGLETFQEAIYR
jgi:ferredoxin-nitrite reductase